tara:strand:+ start:177 stop:413 length:237 start_codon:yes stop_codon:yes gene_type:complete
MADILDFPTNLEAKRLRKDMEEMENAIKENLENLQLLNEEVVQLTVAYEDMLRRLCEITGVQLPPDFSHLGDDDGDVD